jgi:hypothetical protein
MTDQKSTMNNSMKQTTRSGAVALGPLTHRVVRMSRELDPFEKDTATIEAADMHNSKDTMYSQEIMSGEDGRSPKPQRHAHRLS